MRRAFTLIEIIISVAILFLLVFFLTANYRTMQSALEQSRRFEAIEKNDDDFQNLLIADILQAESIAAQRGREYDVLYLNDTRNSLYGRSRCFVAYAVLKPSKTLARIEGAAAFKLPIVGNDAYKYDFLPFNAPLKSFKYYKSQKSAAADQNASNSCSVLLYIAAEESEQVKLLELGLLNSGACK